MASVTNSLVFLLVNGALVWSSWRLAGLLLQHNDSFSQRLTATGLLAFAHATIVVLFLGVVVRSLGVQTVPILSLVISVSMLLGTWRKTASQPGMLCQGKAAWCALLNERDLVAYVLIGLFLLQAGVMLAKVVWLPPHVWDVFVYHLPPAVEWYQQGFIPPVLDTPISRINGAPLGMTMMAYWFFIFFQDDGLVELPMLLWALLLLPVSIAVMRQSGVSRAWSLKFAIVIFFVPVVLMQGVTVKDHLGLNISFVAALLFLVEFLRTRQYSLLLVVAIAFGLMLGYKIVAPLYILIAMLVAAALIWTQQRDLIADKGSLIRLGKLSIVSVVIMTVIGGYWYLRNIIVYGRLQGAYGITHISEGVDKIQDSGAIDAISSKIAETQFWYKNLLELYPRVFDFRFDYSPDLIGISGFGPQFAAFGLLALLVGVLAIFKTKQRQQPIFLLSTTAILLFSALWFVNYNGSSYRVLSFFPIILIGYAAVLLFSSQLMQRRGFSLILNTLLIACVLWNALFMLLPKNTNLLQFAEFISLDEVDRTSANYTSWFSIHRPSFYRLLSEVPVSEPIAHVAYKGKRFSDESYLDTWQYLYYDRHWRRRVQQLNLFDNFECEGIRCTPKPVLKSFLHDNNIHFVSSCKINHCLLLIDDELFEVMPGLYYYRGRG